MHEPVQNGAVEFSWQQFLPYHHTVEDDVMDEVQDALGLQDLVGHDLQCDRGSCQSPGHDLIVWSDCQVARAASQFLQWQLALWQHRLLPSLMQRPRGAVAGAAPDAEPAWILAGHLWLQQFLLWLAPLAGVLPGHQ